MKILSTLSLLHVAAAISVAQIPEPLDAPKPQSPSKSAAAFALPDGFRMELVASEPLIASPTGVCWDERGRMFVTELHGYNLPGELEIQELNKAGKLDTQVRRVAADPKYYEAAKKGTFGVVKMLRDTDGDGVMDAADVWADDLPPAYGLVAARGGVIVACAPHIIYLADRDGDGKAEVREVLFTGFRTGELERGINAPQWGDDGWIYFGRGWGGDRITGLRLTEPVAMPRTDFRIRADGSAIEPVTGGTHTFGFAITQASERFVISTMSPGIYVAPLPWRYLARNPDVGTPGIDAATGDRRAYAIATPHPWRSRRAEDAGYFKYYRDRYGASDSDAGGWFTSACSPLVYRDHALPGLHGQYFACDPAGSLIHRAAIKADGSMLTLHRLPGEEKKEFAASSDSWSHPMFLAHGPDGAIWVVDFYREIIEDYSAIPRHLQQQYGLYAGHDRGRIYRLTHKDMPAAPKADMHALEDEALAGECASALYWRRQTGQRLLVERKAESVAPALRRIITDEASKPAAIIAALQTLEGLQAMKSGDLQPVLRHADRAVRVHALQLADGWFARAPGRELLAAAVAVAEQETDPRVLIQFALSLGESDSETSLAALAELARKHLSIRWMDAAILSSLRGRGAPMLARLLPQPGGGKALIEPLAQAIAARNDEAEIAATFKRIAQAEAPAQALVLAGLAKGRKGLPRKPLTHEAAIMLLAGFEKSEDATVRTRAGELAATFRPAPADGPKTLPKDMPSAVQVSDETFRRYTKALELRRNTKRGHEVFTQVCSTCHRVGNEGHVLGPDLMGELGVAEETLVRHLLLPSERIRPGYETTMIQTKEGEPVVGLMINDGATSLTLLMPRGVEQVILRKDIADVRQLKGSLMPSFADTMTPQDMAHLLGWLTSQLRPEDAGRAVLFDEEPGFAALLTEEAGKAAVINKDAHTGRLCLHIMPPQKAAKRISGWDYRIVEKPSAPGEFRYLRLSWRASADGVMLELANDGRWPRAEDAAGRYYAGRNTTTWQAKQVNDTAPKQWTTITVDLWKDMGSFKLTGLAPTAMGGEAWFDRIELLREP
ncbi:MAG: PVC-type heme-binding CxxCH protein [Phycisphaeraceae bacterium]